MLYGLAQLIHLAATVYIWIIIASVVVSWIRVDPYHPVVRFLNRATEPVFSAVRRAIPLNLGGIDFTPMIVLLAIYLLERLLIKMLLGGLRW